MQIRREAEGQGQVRREGKGQVRRVGQGQVRRVGQRQVRRVGQGHGQARRKEKKNEQKG